MLQYDWTQCSAHVEWNVLTRRVAAFGCTPVFRLAERRCADRENDVRIDLGWELPLTQTHLSLLMKLMSLDVAQVIDMTHLRG